MYHDVIKCNHVSSLHVLIHTVMQMNVRNLSVFLASTNSASWWPSVIRKHNMSNSQSAFKVSMKFTANRWNRFRRIKANRWHPIINEYFDQVYLHRRLPHIRQIALQLQVIHHVNVCRSFHTIDTCRYNRLTVSATGRGCCCVRNKDWDKKS